MLYKALEYQYMMSKLCLFSRVSLPSTCPLGPPAIQGLGVSVYDVKLYLFSRVSLPSTCPLGPPAIQGLGVSVYDV